MTEEEFLRIYQSQQTVVTELEYRLYYDELGFPLFYSTEKVPGNYIVVDQETYMNSPKHVRIIDGKLKIIKTVYGKKLVQSDQGQACHPLDVAVVVATDQSHVLWSIKHEEPVND